MDDMTPTPAPAEPMAPEAPAAAPEAAPEETVA